MPEVVDGEAVQIIDQTRFPHAFEIIRLETVQQAVQAIPVMQVRGAHLIGATAAFGMCLAHFMLPVSQTRSATKDDITANMSIRLHGSEIIANIAQTKKRDASVNILTHFNAG